MTVERSSYLLRKECGCITHDGPCWLNHVAMWSRMLEEQAARIDPSDPYNFLGVRALLQEDRARLMELRVGMQAAGFMGHESLSEALMLAGMDVPWRHRCADIMRGRLAEVTH